MPCAVAHGVPQAVRVLLAPPFAPELLRGAHVVVIDVLRATTTIATALANGAAGVVPVLDPEDALAVARRLGRERVLLCGERDATLIAGFDLDNSPAAYARETVQGRTLVFTTTNGTRAIRAATAPASLRTAALINRRAVAETLAALDGEVVILCAGVQGRFALEDAIGAGALVDGIAARAPHVELDDGARAAALLFRSVAMRLQDAIASADHALALAAKGLSGDLAGCAELDALDVVPTLREGVLVAARDGAISASPPLDAAHAIAERLDSSLPGFRERHAGEYVVRGNVNGTLLAGALQAYTAVAFRERRGDEAVRAIADAFEAALTERLRGADNLVESYLEGTAEWPQPWRDALARALGPAAGRTYEMVRRFSA